MTILIPNQWILFSNGWEWILWKPGNYPDWRWTPGPGSAVSSLQTKSQGPVMRSGKNLQAALTCSVCSGLHFDIFCGTTKASVVSF